MQRYGCISFPSVGLYFSNIFQSSVLASENVGSPGHWMRVVHASNSSQESNGSVECSSPNLYVMFGKQRSL